MHRGRQAVLDCFGLAQRATGWLKLAARALTKQLIQRVRWAAPSAWA